MGVWLIQAMLLTGVSLQLLTVNPLGQALPSDKPEDWQPREEVLDLWSLYITKATDRTRQEELAKILDIPPEEAQSLRKHVDSGDFKLEQDESEADIF